MTSGLMWRAWGGLLPSVQTGEAGFDQVYGMPLWRYLTERDPAAGALFNAAMADASAAVHLPIAQAAELSGVQLVGGDFFAAVPAGADASVMTWILHGWDDAAGLQLLGSCRRAMAAHSRLLVVELVVDPERSDELGSAVELQMLVALAGKERTAAQCRAVYDAAGLRLTRIIPTASIFSRIEGIPQGNGQDRS